MKLINLKADPPGHKEKVYQKGAKSHEYYRKSNTLVSVPASGEALMSTNYENFMFI